MAKANKHLYWISLGYDLKCRRTLKTALVIVGTYLTP